MSYIHDYAILTSGNEAPQIFHRWAALSCLSHAVGRKAWVNWGILGKIFPHMYLILVGEPGSKKSTAMDIARKLVVALKTIPTAGASVTKESLCQSLGGETSRCAKVYKLNDKPVRYSQMSIFANELVNLINSGGNPIGMIDFFTDVWDRDEYIVETKNKGSDNIPGPYISILGCLTPKTVRSLMSQKIISAGMTRRCIFVMANRADHPEAFPELTQEMLEARGRILEHLELIKDFQGELAWQPSARETFRLWYNENFERKKTEQDDILLGFLETKPELVIKVAMLIQLGNRPIVPEITSESILGAAALLTECERTGSYLFSGTGRNELSPIGVSILRLVELEALPINRKKLYMLFMNDANIQEIDQILDSMVRTDQLEVRSIAQRGVTQTLVSTKPKMLAFLTQLGLAEKGSGQGSHQPA